MLFASLVLAILYRLILDTLEIIDSLVQDGSTIQDLFLEYAGGVRWLLLAILFFYIVTNLVVAVVYTHRMVGPIVAFRRHVAFLLEEDYSKRVHLRRGDAFHELAEDLNVLTEKLESGRRVASSEPSPEASPNSTSGAESGSQQV